MHDGKAQRSRCQVWASVPLIWKWDKRLDPGQDVRNHGVSRGNQLIERPSRFDNHLFKLGLDVRGEVYFHGLRIRENQPDRNLLAK